MNIMFIDKLFDQKFTRVDYFLIVFDITITSLKNIFEELKTSEMILHFKMLEKTAIL